MAACRCCSAAGSGCGLLAAGQLRSTLSAGELKLLLQSSAGLCNAPVLGHCSAAGEPASADWLLGLTSCALAAADAPQLNCGPVAGRL